MSAHRKLNAQTRLDAPASQHPDSFVEGLLGHTIAGSFPYYYRWVGPEALKGWTIVSNSRVIAIRPFPLKWNGMHYILYVASGVSWKACLS